MDVWGTICLEINGVKALLYLADTPEKQAEGYRFKNSADFAGKGAVGMLFNLSYQGWGGVTFTMRDVAFPLYLLHVRHVEGLGDLVVEAVLMIPWHDYPVSYQPGDYFIEMDPGFFTREILKGKSPSNALVRVAGVC